MIYGTQLNKPINYIRNKSTLTIGGVTFVSLGLELLNDNEIRTLKVSFIFMEFKVKKKKEEGLA